MSCKRFQEEISIEEYRERFPVLFSVLSGKLSLGEMVVFQRFLWEGKLKAAIQNDFHWAEPETEQRAYVIGAEVSLPLLLDYGNAFLSDGLSEKEFSEKVGELSKNRRLADVFLGEGREWRNRAYQDFIRISRR
jgi:hypothetical protein